MSRLRVGIDLVQISRIAKALEAFGDRFVRRVFTDGEADYARDPLSRANRLATRWAAKEAAKKVLRGDGIGWREIEVVRDEDGVCHIVTHGVARTLAERIGAHDFALSMSRDGDYATAIVVAACETP